VVGGPVEMRSTAAETGGELVAHDVAGRARGFLRQKHVHDYQRKRHEVVEGSLRLVIDGREHLLGAGAAMEVPPDAAHRQLAGPEPSARIRIQLRPAGQTEEFLKRIADMARAGEAVFDALADARTYPH
jgi:quercetin dioxygenase-like cupin family protein